MEFQGGQGRARRKARRPGRGKTIRGTHVRQTKITQNNLKYAENKPKISPLEKMLPLASLGRQQTSFFFVCF
jgi:hypothetical protein